MKRFRFSLQPVAILRAHREAQARDALAAAAGACTQAEEKLAEARARIAQFERTLAADRQRPFSGVEQAEALAAYRQERIAEGAAEQAVNAARATLQQRRAEYLEAHRNVELVKRLEQKARRLHGLECAREEQAAFDDLAARRFLNRRNSVSA